MKSPLLLTAAILLFQAIELHAVEIAAHRGASYDAPENTLASFRLGYEQKADADELDIYLSKDGKIVVMHDPTTKRTAGLDQPIVAQDFAALRELDAGIWKGPQWKGEKIPTLSEVLALIPDGKKLFIEIKCGPEILPELEQALTASQKKPEQLVIIGFDYEVMRLAKLRFPKLVAYWLVSPEKKTERIPPLEELISKTKAAGLDGLNLNFKFPIDAAYSAQVHAAGLKLLAWTVDDPVVAKKLVAAGVDGITTNRPGWLREQLQ